MIYGEYVSFQTSPVLLMNYQGYISLSLQESEAAAANTDWPF